MIDTFRSMTLRSSCERSPVGLQSYTKPDASGATRAPPWNLQAWCEAVEIAWSQFGTMVDSAMRVIALSTLKAFLERNDAYADAHEPVMACYRQVRTADWATPADVKRDIRTASILKDGRVVFNIAGNKYRIVVWINYPYRVVYIRFIGAHRQYDRIDAQTV